MKKFRVWDEDENKYSDDEFYLDNNGNLFYLDCEDRIVDADARALVVEFFTGLHDCNGVEIFEGDVIKLKYNDPKIVAVEYDNTMGQWIGSLANKTCTRFDYLHLSSEEMREIIGNIHEEDK